MRAHEADLAVAVRPRHEQRAADAERLLVLRDLVALRVVGIEVVLAREDGLVGDLAAEREAELDRPLDRLRFATGSAPGCARQTGHVRVFGSAEVLELAAAEHLRPRLQMDVDLEPDDGFPLSAMRGPPSPRAARARCRLSPRPCRARCSSGPRIWISQSSRSPASSASFTSPTRTARAPSRTRDVAERAPAGRDEVGRGIDDLPHRKPLRDGVEAERALERVPDAEERVLGELRADELQSDGKAFAEPARDAQPRQARPCSTGSSAGRRGTSRAGPPSSRRARTRPSATSATRARRSARTARRARG